MADDANNRFTVWSAEHPGCGEFEICASRGGAAAKNWVEMHWPKIGCPDEVCVHVRRHSDGKLFAYDVYVEDVELTLTALSIKLNEDGSPMTVDQMRAAEEPTS